LDADFHVGLDDSEHHRVARLVRDAPGSPAGSTGDSTEGRGREELRALIEAFMSPDSLAMRSLGLASAPHAPSNNDPRWRRAQVPAANGHGNARALARVYGALARGGELDGVRIISAEGVERAAHEQVGAPTPCSSCPPAARWGSCFPCRASLTGEVRAASATPGRVGRSATQTPTGRWGSAMR
jgi:hypothetical protein